MVLTTVDLTDKANKSLRVYMAENEVSDKRVAINKILEDM